MGFSTISPSTLPSTASRSRETSAFDASVSFTAALPAPTLLTVAAAGTLPDRKSSCSEGANERLDVKNCPNQNIFSLNRAKERYPAECWLSRPVIPLREILYLGAHTCCSSRSSSDRAALDRWDGFIK